MERSTVYERLTTVFRDVFDDDELMIDDETTAEDIEDWDSLEHINLIVAVEEEFGIKFSMKQANGMKNVGEMVDIIISQSKCG